MVRKKKKKKKPSHCAHHVVHKDNHMHASDIYTETIASGLLFREMVMIRDQDIEVLDYPCVNQLLPMLLYVSFHKPSRSDVECKQLT